MYDELARTQRPGALERLVVNALIPSVVVTFALHEPSATRAVFPPPVPLSTAPFVLINPCYPVRLDLPDVFPVLVRMPHVVYPPALRRSGADGRVLLKALVDANGRVEPASILVLRTSDVRFLAPARRALIAARFRPAWRNGVRLKAWITMSLDFTLRQE